MEKIFYADKRKFSSTTAAVQKILFDFYHVDGVHIVKNENGKPYIENPPFPLFLSVSHTDNALFIALSCENVGLDAERLDRKVAHGAIIAKFDKTEQAEIASNEAFLMHWTAKESAIKWLGGTLAHDLKALSFIDGKLTYKSVELPVSPTFIRFDNYLLSVCCEKDFTGIIPVVLE